MSINEAMQICIKNNVKVYGVKRGSEFFVEINEKGKKTSSKIRYNNNKDLNEAVKKTYIHFANKILLNKPENKEQNEPNPSNNKNPTE